MSNFWKKFAQYAVAAGLAIGGSVASGSISTNPVVQKVAQYAVTGASAAIGLGVKKPE